jgi:hypothetical protein
MSASFPEEPARCTDRRGPGAARFRQRDGGAGRSLPGVVARVKSPSTRRALSLVERHEVERRAAERRLSQPLGRGRALGGIGQRLAQHHQGRRGPPPGVWEGNGPSRPGPRAATGEQPGSTTPSAEVGVGIHRRARRLLRAM